MKKLSIIVPVYNVEGYVERCIESLFRQDLPIEEYEVVAVDNMSTDGSREILERLAAERPSIRIADCNVQGLSPTRNKGLELATGKYVMFVDSDDYLVDNVLGKICSQMEANRLDMGMMTYSMVDESGRVYKTRNITRVERNDERVKTGRDVLIERLYRAPVWMYIFNRTFLEKSGVRMLNIAHEDENFTPKILSMATRVKYIPIDFYRYYIRSQSIMNDYKPRNLTDVLKGMADMRDFIVSRSSDDPQLTDVIKLRASAYTMSSIKRSLAEHMGNEYELITLARQLGLLPLYGSGFNFKRLLINTSPGLFVRYYRLVGKKKKQKVR